MHTSIVLLTLGVAVAVVTGSLTDHAELIVNRNLAADRADRAAVAFINGCGGDGCNSASLNATRVDGTGVSGCVRQSPSGAVLLVEAQVPWNPTVLTGLSPSFATTAVELEGFSVAATSVLGSC